MFLIAVWVLLMGMEFINLAFIVVHAFYYLRAGTNRSQLTRAVYHDGILYYLYLFAISTINLIIVLRISSDAVLLLTTMIRVLHSILTCRMILQIREQLGRLQSRDIYISQTD
ncbi:hypothetical protein BDQ17DRAFT_1346927 [Cyathus striatus]|nr:hypothetical protein BDQ17DRAFT_1346927 [Cyathus striatus]